ncbi:MAG: hypothetical protein ABI769_08405 [Pseudomonadota bacterium]
MDATRGALMLFSCLAHFAWWIHGSYPHLSGTLAGIGMIATPSFLLVSGAMVGLLCSTPARAGRDLTSQLFNRGLFLITVGHFLISLSEAHSNGGLFKTLTGVSVVDEIGLSTLIAALLVPRLSNPQFCRRVAEFAAATLLASWVANLLWMPESAFGMGLKNVLIGGNAVAGHTGSYTGPTLQYMALYALGLPLGHLFGAFAGGRVTASEIAKSVATTGASLLALCCVLLAVRYAIDHGAFFDQTPRAGLDLTLRVTVKSPPSPAYALFFCGFGLLMVASAFWLSDRRSAPGTAVLQWLAVIGRASLFVFILQYFLYWTLPDLLGIEPNVLCFALFLGNVWLMQRAAILWGRFHGNRHLTFGIKLQRRPS